MYNEIYELNNKLLDLCDLFAEINLKSLSDSEREDYEKRLKYYETRFSKNN